MRTSLAGERSIPAARRKGSVYVPARSPQQELSEQQHRPSTRGRAFCARSRAEETKFFQRQGCQPCCRIVGDSFHPRANIYERLCRVVITSPLGGRGICFLPTLPKSRFLAPKSGAR